MAVVRRPTEHDEKADRSFAPHRPLLVSYSTEATAEAKPTPDAWGTAPVQIGTILQEPTANDTKPTLGPYGYGSVKLGMSVEQAKATGAIVRKKSVKEGRCTGWDLKRFPTAKNDANIYISSKRGVALIFAAKGVKTPEGIKIGSTLQQVRTAYPGVKQRVDVIWTAKVPGNKKAHYTFYLNERTGKVNGIGLFLNKQDCNFAY